MIPAQATQTFEAAVEGFPPGSATVGVRVDDPVTGTTYTPRTTTGIVENPVGSGYYLTTLTAPVTPSPTARPFRVLWDTGGTAPQYAAEELVVTVGPPSPVSIYSSSIYANVADFRAYTGLTATDADDTAVAQLIAGAQIDLDQYVAPNSEIIAATGLRLDTTSMNATQLTYLNRATCAQALYRRLMGAAFFYRPQYRKVSGPDFTTEGKLPILGPQALREMRSSGLIRRTARANVGRKRSLVSRFFNSGDTPPSRFFGS